MTNVPGIVRSPEIDTPSGNGSKVPDEPGHGSVPLKGRQFLVREPSNRCLDLRPGRGTQPYRRPPGVARGYRSPQGRTSALALARDARKFPVGVDRFTPPYTPATKWWIY
jgi:hypothetical protein